MSSFNCKSFLGECHAACCGVFPIEKELFEKHSGKIVSIPKEIHPFYGKDPFDKTDKDFIIAMTEDFRCCFLQDDYSCAIYEDRPMICKKYGDETAETLFCHWQDKRGNRRTPKEKKKITDASRKHLLEFIKKSRRA